MKTIKKSLNAGLPDSAGLTDKAGLPDRAGLSDRASLPYRAGLPYNAGLHDRAGLTDRTGLPDWFVYAAFLAGTFLVMIIFASLPGCNMHNPNEPSASGNVSFSAASDKSLEVINQQDVLVIQEAKVLINDLKIHVKDDDSSGDDFGENLKIGPFVINLSLDSRVTPVSLTSIPPGNYLKVKFEIHKLQGNEVSPDPDFVDADGRYSVVVKGTFNGEAFVYKSKVTANQQYHLQPSLNVVLAPSYNLTFFASPLMWFTDINGLILDPRTESNRETIDYNIKSNLRNHIRVFVDNDFDGKPDL